MLSTGASKDMLRTFTGKCNRDPKCVEAEFKDLKFVGGTAAERKEASRLWKRGLESDSGVGANISGFMKKLESGKVDCIGVSQTGAGGVAVTGEALPGFPSNNCFAGPGFG
jgi:hypothetical protein